MVASLVWERLGDVASYCEPFAGSLAVLLGRPSEHRGAVETVNDLDGFVANAWRAILHDPESTAHHADWPVNENDLHARHAWLVRHRDQLQSRLEGDPDYYDAKIAGWWLWGIACWIGGGFCSGQGPWQQVDGQLVHLGNAGQGVNRKLVHLGDAGRGVNRQLVHLGSAGQGVNRQLVHLGNAGQGVNRKLVHLGNAGRGVNRKLVHLGPNRGVAKDTPLTEWLLTLHDRLQRVRVCSGDWSRVVTPTALASQNYQPVGIFLDPPYSDEADRAEVYARDDGDVAHHVRHWCLQADPAWRICLAGYEGEGHDELEADGWTVTAWTAPGGMQANKDQGGNRTRERLWFSPACLEPAQLTLL